MDTIIISFSLCLSPPPPLLCLLHYLFLILISILISHRNVDKHVYLFLILSQSLIISRSDMQSSSLWTAEKQQQQLVIS